MLVVMDHEADAFWCFAALMDRVERNFHTDCTYGIGVFVCAPGCTKESTCVGFDCLSVLSLADAPVMVDACMLVPLAG